MVHQILYVTCQWRDGAGPPRIFERSFPGQASAPELLYLPPTLHYRIMARYTI